ncbi:MAG TPA: hypothetical protein VMY59_03510 [Candidatus Thermoplasmatota archaeon]|nr:hypothetical protein [Candidatus Thermoplasmatota archaeon]
MSKLLESHNCFKNEYIDKEYPGCTLKHFNKITQQHIPKSQSHLIGSPFAWLCFLPIKVRGYYGEKILERFFFLMEQEYCKDKGRGDGLLNREEIEIKTSVQSRNGNFSANQVRSKGPSKIYLLCFFPTVMKLYQCERDKLRQFGGRPSESEHKQIPITEEIRNNVFCEVKENEWKPSLPYLSFWG